MPLYGTLDITHAPARLPTLAHLDTEAWTLPKAEVMQLLIEVPRSSTDGLLPKAMHPALPSYVILAITRYSDSPVGPFNLAMLRLGSRAGAHPRGFMLGAVASTEPAAKELRMFGLAGWTVDRFIARRTTLHALQYEATRLRERSVLSSLGLVGVANLIVFWSLADAAADGRIDLGRTVTFAQAAVGASLIAFGVAVMQTLPPAPPKADQKP